MLARDFSHTVHSIIRRAHKLRAETLRGPVLFGRNTAKREQLRTRTPACARRGQGSLAQANVERGKRARANVERGQSARHCSVANANVERRACHRCWTSCCVASTLGPQGVSIPQII